MEDDYSIPPGQLPVLNSMVFYDIINIEKQATPHL
jgi:hypothetical protein